MNHLEKLQKQAIFLLSKDAESEQSAISYKTCCVLAETLGSFCSSKELFFLLQMKV